MSRSIERDPTDRLRDQHPNSRMPLSQGRGGNASSGESKSGSRDMESPRSTVNRNASAYSELANVIDDAAAGKPSISEFIDRLDARGVQVIPSIQCSGRLNGMSYRCQGVVVKG